MIAPGVLGVKIIGRHDERALAHFYPPMHCGGLVRRCTVAD
jgi:hypothetical protein